MDEKEVSIWVIILCVTVPFHFILCFTWDKKIQQWGLSCAWTNSILGKCSHQDKCESVSYPEGLFLQKQILGNGASSYNQSCPILRLMQFCTWMFLKFILSFSVKWIKNVIYNNYFSQITATIWLFAQNLHGPGSKQTVLLCFMIEIRNIGCEQWGGVGRKTDGDKPERQFCICTNTHDENTGGGEIQTVRGR